MYSRPSILVYWPTVQSYLDKYPNCIIVFFRFLISLTFQFNIKSFSFVYMFFQRQSLYKGSKQSGRN